MNQNHTKLHNLSLVFKTVTFMVVIVFINTSLAQPAFDLSLRQRSASERGALTGKADSQQKSVEFRKRNFDRNKRDWTRILSIGSVRDWWKARKIRRQFKDELEALARELGIRDTSVTYIGLHYIDRNIILSIARVARTPAEVKLYLTYLKNLAIRLKEKDVELVHAYNDFIPEIVNLTKTSEELKLSLGYFENLCVARDKIPYKYGSDGSRTVPSSIIDTIRAAQTIEELNLFLQFGTTLAERYIDLGYLFACGIPNTAKVARTSEELSLFMQLGMDLIGLDVDPTNTLAYRVPATIRVAKTPEQVNSFLEYCKSLAIRFEKRTGLTPMPGYTYTSGFLVLAQIVNTQAELEKCLDSLYSVEIKHAQMSGRVTLDLVVKLCKTVQEFNQIILWLSVSPESLFDIKEVRLAYNDDPDSKLKLTEAVFLMYGCSYLESSTKQARSVLEMRNLVIEKLRRDRDALIELSGVVGPTRTYTESIDLGENPNKPILSSRTIYPSYGGEHEESYVCGYEHDYKKIEHEVPNPAHPILQARIALLEHAIADLEKTPDPSAIAAPISTRPNEISSVLSGI